MVYGYLGNDIQPEYSSNKLCHFLSNIQKPLRLTPPTLTGQDCLTNNPISVARFLHASYSSSSSPARRSRRNREAFEKIING